MGEALQRMPKLAILAGGKATRLYPLTEKLPKFLVPVGGVPFADHLFTLLKRRGIEEIVLCVSHMEKQIKDYVGNGQRYGLNITYSSDGLQQLGTGGAVRKAADIFNAPFFVTYGDSYLDVSYKEISNFFNTSNLDCLMTVFKNRGMHDKSNILFKNGEILKYEKHQPSSEMDYIDYGLSILNAEILFEYPQNKFFDLSLVFKNLVSSKNIIGYEVKNRFYEVGSPQGIKDLHEYLTKTL